ncbi:MAG TPA: hypothetical protein VF867_10060 [Arthrobacter sp.]
MSNSKTSAAGTSFAPNRVEAGVPSGGEFAANRHSESDVVLGQTQLHAGSVMVEDLIGADMNSLLAKYTSAERLVEVAHSSAVYHQAYYNQAGKSNDKDVDDIAQEAILQILERVKKGGPITDFRQLVNSVTANVTVRATANKFRAEDRRAYRLFVAKRDEAQGLLGRSLTQREEDTVAQIVLDEWHDPRHKPSKDFRTPHTVDTSLDRSFGEDGGVESTLGASLVNPENSGHYIEPDSYMDRAFTALETTGAANKAEAKRYAWNAIAERAELPLALPGTISQRKVTEIRKLMEAQEGGVMAACKAWSDGKDSPTTEALFAPFGTIDIHQRESVIGLLERIGADKPEKADIMWASAVAFANNKHNS